MFSFQTVTKCNSCFQPNTLVWYAGKIRDIMIPHDYFHRLIDYTISKYILQQKICQSVCYPSCLITFNAYNRVNIYAKHKVVLIMSLVSEDNSVFSSSEKDITSEIRVTICYINNNCLQLHAAILTVSLVISKAESLHSPASL